MVSSKALLSLSDALEHLEKFFVTRDLTGNDAKDFLEITLGRMTEDDAKILKGVINRDQRINMGRSNINKVFKNLIVKQPYSRCAIGDEKNLSKMDWASGVISQTKEDGTYRSFNIQESQFTARSGKDDSFPVLEAAFAEFSNNFILVGEMTLRGETQRSKGNGLINSDNPPHEDIIYTIWDMIPTDEYKSKNGTTLYKDRFSLLEDFILAVNHENVKLINHRMVYSVQEAYSHFQELTEEGLEGTVIKDPNMTWKDGTSKQQLKVKLEIDAEVRCIGFTEGTKGTKREATFGAMMYTNDEGSIKGQTSGFTDELLEEFSNNKEKYIGKVFTVQFNDVTKASGSEIYSLSHPRFIEFRDDKDETDTLERVQEMKNMAMTLGGK